MEITIADGWWARLRGLLGRGSPPCGRPLLLAPCRAVHTCGMRFALDLVWVDRGGAVVRIDRGVRPWRLRACRDAWAVLECAAGEGRAVAAGRGARRGIRRGAAMPGSDDPAR